MIPPSITMVISAIMTEQSVGRLLMAGLIPGRIDGRNLLDRYRLACQAVARARAATAAAGQPCNQTSFNPRRVAHRLPIVPVLAGLYSGLYPASAAGAMGAFWPFLSQSPDAVERSRLARHRAR